MATKLELILKAVDKMSPVLKKVQQHSVLGNEKYKKMMQTLQKTQGQLAQIKAFRAMSAESGKNAQALKKAIQVQQELQAKQKSGSKTSQAMLIRMQKQQQQVQDLSRTQKEYIQRLSNQQNKLKAAGIATNRLSAAEKILGKQILQQNQKLARNQAMMQKRKRLMAGIKGGVGGAVNRVGRSGKFAPLALIGGLAAVLRVTNSAAEEIDTLGKTAQRLDMNIGNLQAYEHAAQLAGVENGVLSKSLEQMSKRIGETKAGTGAMVTYLKKSNPALLEQLKTVTNNEQAFELLTEKIASIKDPMQQAALANAAFGRSGQGMLLMLRDGAEGLANARKDIEALGAAFTEQDHQAALKYNDEMLRLGQVSSLIKFKLLIPIMNKLTPTFTRIIEKLKDPIWRHEFIANFKSGLTTTIEVGKKFLALLKPLGAVLGFVIDNARTLATAIGGITIALGILSIAMNANPIGGIIFVLKGAVLIAIAFADKWDSIIQAMKNFANNILISIITPIEGLLALIDKIPKSILPDSMGNGISKTLNALKQYKSELNSEISGKVAINAPPQKSEIIVTLQGDQTAQVQSIKSPANLQIKTNASLGDLSYMNP